MSIPQITLNTKRSKVPPIWSTITLESQISLFSLYSQPFSNNRPFWNKCTEWPPNDPEHYPLETVPGEASPTSEKHVWLTILFVKFQFDFFSLFQKAPKTYIACFAAYSTQKKLFSLVELQNHWRMLYVYATSVYTQVLVKPSLGTVSTAPTLWKQSLREALHTHSDKPLKRISPENVIFAGPMWGLYGHI